MQKWQTFQFPKDTYETFIELHTHRIITIHQGSKISLFLTHSNTHLIFKSNAYHFIYLISKHSWHLIGLFCLKQILSKSYQENLDSLDWFSEVLLRSLLLPLFCSLCLLIKSLINQVLFIDLILSEKFIF